MSCEVRFRLPNDAAPPRTIELPAGTTLLEAVQQAGLPIARACGGDGLCARCGVEVLAGAETLEAESEKEARAKRRNRVAAELRLACQVRLRGAVEITASYW